MTRQEVRVFFQDWFCGCGSPDDAVRFVRDVLRLHPLYENREAFKALVPDDGMEYFVLYTIDHFDLSEHGGTVGGGWLTDKGKALLEALERESDLSVFSEQSCIHGYAVDTDELLTCPECGPVNRKLQPETKEQP